jgi:hypothetical protein
LVVARVAALDVKPLLLAGLEERQVSGGRVANPAGPSAIFNGPGTTGRTGGRQNRP